MEFAAIICLIVIVWYYGNSLKTTQESTLKYNMLIHAELANIKEYSEKIDAKIELQTDLINDALHSANVEWDFFNKEKVDSIINKFDDIKLSGSSLDEIFRMLDKIESEVFRISSHPAFTLNNDDD